MKSGEHTFFRRNVMMKPPLQKPERVPEAGMYYHYKHNPLGPANNYAYYLVGIGCDTETGQFLALYLPLYSEASVYQAGKLYDVRPLTMWLENVTVDGKTIPRFAKIVSPRIVEYLEKIRKNMYGF